MVFQMSKIGRIVELDDEIVSQYLKTVEPSVVTESPFILALKQDFGHYPNEDEMSSAELSKYCDNVLLQELQFSTELPKIAQFLATGGENALKTASSQQKAIKCMI